MANIVTIEAEARERAGKGAARATRRAGKVPAVIYGAKQAPSLIALDPRAVLRELHRPGWQSRVYEMSAPAAPVRALIRDVQFHPVSDAPEHVDFQRLAPGERIRVAVPVHFENEGLPRHQARRRAERRAPRGGGVLRPGPHPGAVRRRPRRAGLQRQRPLARPEGHRGHPAGDHRPRLRGGDRGAADQDGRGRGRDPRRADGAARRPQRRPRSPPRHRPRPHLLPRAAPVEPPRAVPRAAAKARSDRGAGAG